MHTFSHSWSLKSLNLQKGKKVSPFNTCKLIWFDAFKPWNWCRCRLVVKYFTGRIVRLDLLWKRECRVCHFSCHQKHGVALVLRWCCLWPHCVVRNDFLSFFFVIKTYQCHWCTCGWRCRPSQGPIHWTELSQAEVHRRGTEQTKTNPTP